MHNLIERGDGEKHFLPKGDHRAHRCIKECWCGPWLDDGVWIHNAADRWDFTKRPIVEVGIS